MVTVPALNPWTDPDELTEAIDGLLLDQAPPVMVSVNDMLDPAQTVDEPLMLPMAGPPVKVMTL